MTSPAGPGRAAGTHSPRAGTDRRAWLGHQGEGRLGYRSGRGARSVVVRFALAGEDIRIRLTEYHEAVGYAPGQQVCLQVEAPVGPRHQLETVLIRGQARLADGELCSVEDDATLDEHWPDGLATHDLVLPLTHVAVLRHDQLLHETGTG